MLFSFDAIESLPFFSKLPFNSFEKRILGITILTSFALLTFSLSLLILFRTNEKKEIPETAQEIVTEELKYEYDALEIESILLNIKNLINSKEYSKAGNLLEKISYISPKSPEQNFITAQLLLLQERALESRKITNKLTEEYPANITYWILNAKSYSSEDLHNSMWEKLFKDVKNSPQILTTVAEILHNSEPEEAMMILNKSYELNPSISRTSYLLGKLHARKETLSDLKKAYNYLHFATNQSPDSANYHSTLGLTQHQLWNEFDRNSDSLFHNASQSYKRALDVQPNNPATLYNLGELYAEKKEYKNEAESCFLQAVKSNPEFWQASFKLGLLYLKNKKYSGALTNLNNALKHSPDNIRILHQIAITHENLGNVEETKNTYNHILKIAPKDDIALHKTLINK